MFDAPCQCVRCGQSAVADATLQDFAAFVCPSCRKAEREPQGQVVRLFEPAPTQIAGQLGF